MGVCLKYRHRSTWLEARRVSIEAAITLAAELIYIGGRDFRITDRDGRVLMEDSEIRRAYDDGFWHDDPAGGRVIVRA